MPQYHFDRDVFVETFFKVFGSDNNVTEVITSCQAHDCFDTFQLYYADDEFYILHIPSGTIINWYKHLGRTNTCNKEKFTVDDLTEFLELLRGEMWGYYE